MQLLRRAASAFLALWLLFGAFSATPTPVRAEETGGELGAVVFGFDFSPSIYCTGDADKPGCVPIGAELASAVDALATHLNSSTSRTIYLARNIKYRVVEFGKESLIARVGNEPCIGATGTEDGIDLLVACLGKIASDYRGPDSPAPALRGTQFEPILREVMPPLGGRCGLILFTDGEPDGDAARRGALGVFKDLKGETGHCAVLPIATGDISDEGLTFLKAITLDELADSPLCRESETEKFTWPEVYFRDPNEAVKKIREAFAYVSCAPLVPVAPECITVDSYEQILTEQEFLSETDAPGSYYFVGTIPAVGETASREVPIKIIGQEAPPGGCAVESPTPTEPPPPPPPPAPPCVADGPLSWLGCNPWILLVLLGLVLARLWWIARDLQVSINGQEAVALRGGTLVGFDVHGGDASRVANPNRAEVKISRSFFRFFPGTRVNAAALDSSPITASEKFEIGKPIELTSALTARVNYGNPRRVTYSGGTPDEPTDFSSDSGSSSGGSVSSAL